MKCPRYYNSFLSCINIVRVLLFLLIEKIYFLTRFTLARVSYIRACFACNISINRKEIFEIFEEEIFVYDENNKRL